MFTQVYGTESHQTLSLPGLRGAPGSAEYGLSRCRLLFETGMCEQFLSNRTPWSIWKVQLAKRLLHLRLGNRK